MVRTKQPRKTRTSRNTTDESESLVKDFENQVNYVVRKLEADLSMQINMLSNSVDVMLATLPKEIRDMTLDELLAEDPINDNREVTLMETSNDSEMSTVSKSAVRGKNRKKERATGASDDGYATESTTAKTSHVSRINAVKNSSVSRQARKHRSSSNRTNSRTSTTTRSTRSTSRNSRLSTEQQNRNDLLKTTGRCPATASKYKTPASKGTTEYFGAVTPKIKPNAPMNVLRRPRQGEMVLSMQGSPLLVSSVIQEQTANINVPLNDGNVISLLPKSGLRRSQLPPLDDETLSQLKTLMGHIGTVIGENKV